MCVTDETFQNQNELQGIEDKHEDLTQCQKNVNEYETEIYSPHTMAQIAMFSNKKNNGKSSAYAKIFRADTTAHVMFYQPNKANRSSLGLSPETLSSKSQATVPVLHQRSYVNARIIAQIMF